MAEYENTPVLSKVKISGETYYLKDEDARAALDEFEKAETASGDFTPKGTIADIDYTPAGTITGGTTTAAGTVSGNLVQDNTSGVQIAGTIQNTALSVTPSTDKFAIQGMVAEYDGASSTLVLTPATTADALTGASVAFTTAPTFVGNKYSINASFAGTPSSVSGMTFTGTEETLSTTFTGTTEKVVVRPDYNDSLILDQVYDATKRSSSLFIE